MKNPNPDTILIINGPNLNLLGRRQPHIYGTETAQDIVDKVAGSVPSDVRIEYRQSNHEGDLVTWIQQAGYDHEGRYIGIILNAGAYTHTSLAIADAIAAIPLPVIEVHISNIHRREEIRHKSLIAPVCRGSVIGLGTYGYVMAADWLVNNPTRTLLPI